MVLACETLERGIPPEQLVRAQAPALLVPRVLSPEQCRALIEVYEQRSDVVPLTQVSRMLDGVGTFVVDADAAPEGRSSDCGRPGPRGIHDLFTHSARNEEVLPVHVYPLRWAERLAVTRTMMSAFLGHTATTVIQKMRTGASRCLSI